MKQANMRDSPWPTYDSDGVKLTHEQLASLSLRGTHNHNHVAARLVPVAKENMSKIGMEKITGNRKLNIYRLSAFLKRL
jgi:hypothetical protein